MQRWSILMVPVSRVDKSLMISSSGYDFMLLPLLSQVWVFIRSYLLSLPKSKRKHEGPDAVPTALLLLFMLSSCAPGVGCSLSRLSKRFIPFMPTLKAFGLIYFTKGSKFFYPTRIAIDLLRDAKDLKISNVWGRRSAAGEIFLRSLLLILPSPLTRSRRRHKTQTLAVVLHPQIQLRLKNHWRCRTQPTHPTSP